eukprot:4501399-Pyramimonas_sp.AAC.1
MPQPFFHCGDGPSDTAKSERFDDGQPSPHACRLWVPFKLGDKKGVLLVVVATSTCDRRNSKCANLPAAAGSVKEN